MSHWNKPSPAQHLLFFCLFVCFTTYQHTGCFSANCLLSFWVRPRTRPHCLAPTHSSALKKRLEIVPRYKNYTKNKIIVYSHTTLNTPDLVWPRKLSRVQPWLVLEWETITSFLRTLVLYDHTTKFQKLSSLEQYCLLVHSSVHQEFRPNMTGFSV